MLMRGKAWGALPIIVCHEQIPGADLWRALFGHEDDTYLIRRR